MLPHARTGSRSPLGEPVTPGLGNSETSREQFDGRKTHPRTRPSNRTLPRSRPWVSKWPPSMRGDRPGNNAATQSQVRVSVSEWPTKWPCVHPNQDLVEFLPFRTLESVPAPGNGHRHVHPTGSTGDSSARRKRSLYCSYSRRVRLSENEKTTFMAFKNSSDVRVNAIRTKGLQ